MKVSSALTHDVGISFFIPVRAPTPMIRVSDGSGRLSPKLMQGRQQFPAPGRLRAENGRVTCTGCLRYRHVILLSYFLVL